MSSIGHPLDRFHSGNDPVTHPTGGPGFLDGPYSLAQVADTVGSVLMERGLTGPPGPSGAGALYIHTQAVASVFWNIVHNFGREPAAVAIIDNSGALLVAEVDHFDANTVTIAFTTPVSGKAVLS